MASSTNDPDAIAFRNSVREWLRSVLVGVSAKDVEDDDFRRAWDGKLYEAGYAGLAWPKEFGGQGLSLLEEYVFNEEAARAGAPEGYGKVGRVLAGPLLQKHGSASQRERYLQPILRGQEVWCQGFSEPGAGSDLAAVGTRATPHGDGYVISGHKIWTSWADEADFCLLLAKTVEDAPRHRNLGMFLLDMKQPGIDVRPIRRNSGDFTFSEVYFDGARVTADNRVGGETDGWKMAMAVLLDERGPIEAIGRYINLSRLTDLMKTCCTGGSISPENELLLARVETVRWHALRSLENALKQRSEPNVDAVMKLMWSHTWQDLARSGESLNCPEHERVWRKQYLESRAASIFSGSTQVHYNIVGERVLGLPR